MKILALLTMLGLMHAGGVLVGYKMAEKEYSHVEGSECFNRVVMSRSGSQKTTEDRPGKLTKDKYTEKLTCVIEKMAPHYLSKQKGLISKG